jgi:cyclase
MQKRDIASRIIVFIDPAGRSSCGMIHTRDGVILVDTTARPVDIQTCLDLAHLAKDDIHLILLTHSHSDHTSGIPLFSCPVLAHRLTRQRIKQRGSERSKKQMPTEVFEYRKELDIGGVVLEMIHTGGHTPGSSVVWLPQERILFAGDLVFEGRYPFLATADIKQLMDVLRWLPSLEARVIVPGHGELCENAEVLRQLHYLEDIWERTADHIKQGHSLEDTLKDSKYVRYSIIFYEQLHDWNIRVAYKQLLKLTEKG